MVQLDRGDELALKLDRWRCATRCLAAWESWSAAKSLDEVELVRGEVDRGGELGRGVGARARR